MARGVRTAKRPWSGKSDVGDRDELTSEQRQEAFRIASKMAAIIDSLPESLRSRALKRVAEVGVKLGLLERR